jgi:heme-degrading monooxygenase HmoA
LIILVRHRVRDFASWKPVFDEQGGIVRTKHGATGHRLYRSLDDPNDVVVLVEFPSEERAGSFLADPALKEEMEQAGVQGEPTVILCEEVDVVSY